MDKILKVAIDTFLVEPPDCENPEVRNRKGAESGLHFSPMLLQNPLSFYFFHLLWRGGGGNYGFSKFERSSDHSKAASET